MDLSCKTIKQILSAVYHFTGFLLPSSLIAIVASPPCTTFSNFDCQHKNHRDHSKPTKPAISEMAKAPTGDLAHDTKYCRNGRIILEQIDEKAKSSTAPYMMAVYRQEGDGQNYEVVRNVYVPLFINGRRWGDYEFAYSF